MDITEAYEMKYSLSIDLNSSVDHDGKYFWYIIPYQIIKMPGMEFAKIYIENCGYEKTYKKCLKKAIEVYKKLEKIR
jgi:hypothetical protein